MSDLSGAEKVTVVLLLAASLWIPIYMHALALISWFKTR